MTQELHEEDELVEIAADVGNDKENVCTKDKSSLEVVGDHRH